jgi:hypothetical protein
MRGVSEPLPDEISNGSVSIAEAQVVNEKSTNANEEEEEEDQFGNSDDESYSFLHDRWYHLSPPLVLLSPCFLLWLLLSLSSLIPPSSKLSLEADKSLPPLCLTGPINVFKTLKAAASKKALDVIDGLNTRVSELETLLKGAHDSYKALGAH